ncbi:outer membrane protein assembly factor BamE [Polaromonas sp.]|uniref:outer membrane protein assembly factor BamE n=1 Tax=Polaromonas sp. TaxID=1869339 RepID=UPI0038621B80
MRSLLTPLLLILCLAGCDPQRIAELEEGVASEADVRTRFGEPEKIWEAGDLAGLPLPARVLDAVAQPGARTFEYNRQPAGQVNYMITIGPDGKLSALRQVLTPQNFERVLTGMPMEKVRKMLGKPMKITPFALKQETHYDWRYMGDPNTARIFTAVFDTDLRVIRTASVDDLRPETGGGNR